MNSPNPESKLTTLKSIKLNGESHVRSLHLVEEFNESSIHRGEDDSLLDKSIGSVMSLWKYFFVESEGKNLFHYSQLF